MSLALKTLLKRLFNRYIILGVSACIILIVSSSILLGWLLQNEKLIYLFLPPPAVMANTALCFFFSGLSLVCICLSFRRLSIAFSSIVIVISGLTLIQYIFRVDLRIDELIFSYFLPEVMKFPGRPAPNGVICFFLIGIAFILTALPYKHITSIFAELLSGLVFPIASFSLFDYVVGLSTIIQWEDGIAVAFHTALGLVLISLCIFYYHIALTRHEPKFFLAPSIGLLSFVSSITIILWQLFYAQEYIALQILADTNANYIANEVVLTLKSHCNSFERLSERIEKLTPFPKTLWDTDVKNYLEDFPSITSITWYDEMEQIKYQSTNPNVQNPLAHTQSIKDLLKKLTPDELKNAFIYALFKEDLVFCFPINDPKGIFKGFLIIEMKFDLFAQNFIPEKFFERYNFSIANQNGIFYEHILPNSISIGEGAFAKIESSFINWTITVFPTNHTLPLVQDFTALFFVVVIGFITVVSVLLLLIISIHLVIKSRQNLSVAIQEKASSLAYQKAIIDSSSYSIISTDPEGLITSFNKASEKLLLWNANDVIGKLSLLSFHEPKILEKKAAELSEKLHQRIEPNFEALSTLAKRGLATEFSCNYIRKDGSKIPVQISVTAVRGPQDKIIGFVSTAYDLTHANELDELKRTLMSITSHELRSPLSAIKSSLSLLLEQEPPSERGRPLIDISLKNCDRLIRLTTDLLDSQKMDAGKMEFHFKTVQLKGVIEKACEFNQPLAKQNQVLLEKPKHIPECTISADEDRLIQVFTNLISNAIKHAPKNSSVSFIISEKEDSVRIGIQDLGPGIPEEFKPHIFEKFSQSSLEKQGSGLGLYISKSIIESHRGTIGVDSSPKGTTFWFELPTLKARKS